MIAGSNYTERSQRGASIANITLAALSLVFISLQGCSDDNCYNTRTCPTSTQTVGAGGIGGAVSSVGGGGVKPNGDACDSAAECASGFCSDDVCCDMVCDGACRA